MTSINIIRVFSNVLVHECKKRIVYFLVNTDESNVASILLLPKPLPKFRQERGHDSQKKIRCVFHDI